MGKGYLIMPDGVHLYYEDHGGGPLTVLLVPGFAASTRAFNHNIPVLAQKYRVVTFDPRCYGRSSVTSVGNNLIGHAKDIKEIIEQLGLKNVVLIGWSCGGGAAATYCRLFHDEHLAAIGLLDTHLHIMSAEAWNTHPNHTHNVYNFKRNYWSWLNGYEGRFANTAFAKDVEKGCYPQVGLTEEDQKAYLEDGEMLFPWAGIELQFDYNITDNLSHLKDITVPAILYRSELYDRKVYEIYQEQIPTYTELHEFKDHFLFYHESERFNAVTLDFLNRLEQGVLKK